MMSGLVPPDNRINTYAASVLALTRYLALLENHDWWYQWSDDGDVYRKGKAEREELRLLADVHDPGREVWKTMAPKGEE